MSIDYYEAPRNEVALAPATQDVAIQRLADWAHSAQAAHQIATTLVQTSFCPDSFRNKPGEATAAILAGMEVGLQPMAALRSFDVIQGQAAARAITLRAIVQSQGHEMELVESTATRCRMRGRRRGSKDWQGVTWTLERAKDLGLTGKSNWKSQPQAMLVARATSELARLVASDAILGLPYSAEEIADGGPTDAQVTAETTAAPSGGVVRTMQRRPPVGPDPSGAEVAPETGPSVESTHPSASESGPGSPLLNTRGKLAKRMFAALNAIGLTERDDRLAFVASVIGHEVDSSAAMTDEDAEAVIAKAESMVEQPFPSEGGEPS